MRALSAEAAVAEPVYIREIAARQRGLVGHLRKFSLPAVTALLAGLLTRIENHTATTRIEALLHLAAMACQGKKKPGQRRLRGWLTEIENDPITKLDIPVEDVFVSNVEADFGNARLFQGRWENNAEYVRACTETLLRIGGRASLGTRSPATHRRFAACERGLGRTLRGGALHSHGGYARGRDSTSAIQWLRESSRHVVFQRPGPSRDWRRA